MLELLVVLAIIVVLASLTWPVMLRYMPEQSLREAGEAVRRHLTLSRLNAVQTGMIYQFRYEPNGRRFVVLPYEQPETQQPTGSRRETTQTTATGARLETASEQLPEGVTFYADAGEPAEILSNDLLALLPDATGLRQVAWSTPILFESTGASEDATVKLVDKELALKVYVRGLTGGVTVGKVREK